MTSGRSDLTDIVGELVHETDKAILLFDGAEKVWLPKAAIEIDRDRADGLVEVTLPERLAKEKGLI